LNSRNIHGAQQYPTDNFIYERSNALSSYYPVKRVSNGPVINIVNNGSSVDINEDFHTQRRPEISKDA